MGQEPQAPVSRTLTIPSSLTDELYVAAIGLEGRAHVLDGALDFLFEHVALLLR